MLIIAGKNNIAVNILEFVLHNLNFPVSRVGAVHNRNDKGVDGWQQSFRKKCIECGVRLYSLDELYFLDNLLFLSLEFDCLLKIKHFRTNCQFYNIHFSYLPQYRGMYTSTWPILNGELYSGVTLHRIDDGIDTGDIIEQVRFDLSNYETARLLYHKYIEYGTALVKKNLKRLLGSKLQTVVQSCKKSSYYDKSSIDYTKLTIDMFQSAEHINRQIRAFNFREYQYPMISEKYCIGSVILTSKSDKKPGTILHASRYSSVLSTIDFDVEIFHLQALDEFISACQNDDLASVKKLVLRFPNIKYQTYEKGWSALIVCAYNCSSRVFHYLYDDNLAKIRGYNGTTLLMYAKSGFVKFHRKDILISLLRRKKSDIHECDYFGKSVIDYCRMNNETEALLLIMKYCDD